MGRNPYTGLPKGAFWKTGVCQEDPYDIEGIYRKKFDISVDERIATAGSCFAQHISRYLRKSGYNVLDAEPPPPGLPRELHQKFGFSMYSARYGNIYSVRQLLQLAEEVAGEWIPKDYVWEKDGKYVDALRPAIEPEGLDSKDMVMRLRQYHLSRVKEIFESLDLFIFTLGLTEMWIHKESGTIYPTAPGAIAGHFDPYVYQFKNAQFGEIISDFERFQQVVQSIRGGREFKILLTVSPVPLTATASDLHVLLSTTLSKSILRSVAGQLSATQHNIDYFPSYEIVNNPRLHSTCFSENLRSVREQAVDNVMNHFFREHPVIQKTPPNLQRQRRLPTTTQEDVKCEEALLEAFSQ